MKNIHELVEIDQVDSTTYQPIKTKVAIGNICDDCGACRYTSTSVHGECKKSTICRACMAKRIRGSQ